LAYQFNKISILVVEDNQPMLDLTKALLGTFGVGQIIGAAHGEAGYKKFCEHNPDLVIADWMMKPMDGISFTRIIRNDPQSPNPYVPIILMTGFSEKRRVLQARDAGVTEFLVKPFNARDLYKRLVQVIERPRQFVKSPDFFGPDRRRRRVDDYTGPLQRETDQTMTGDQSAAQRQREQEAHETLAKIRSQAGLGKSDRFDLKPDDIDWA
jgi:two-component system chemotaxis response regulator CheY